MKKAMPISDDLQEYFTKPCPVLSDNNSQLVLTEIGGGYDFVVEYGMGASTLYFLSEALKHKTVMISVENNFDWFRVCVDQIKEQAPLQEQNSFSKPWSLGEIRSFTNSDSQAPIPQELRRFPRWKDSLSLGPFFRFAPNSKSRLSGKLGPLWPIAKPFLKTLATAQYLFAPQNRPHRAEWRGTSDQLELILRNVGPSLKDQYGESPNKAEYIESGLKEIRGELEKGNSVSALFIVDGGPRHYVVEEILKLEEKFNNFKPSIFLCDAARIFYDPILVKRPTGRFFAGTNRTLKGKPVSNDTSGPHTYFWTGGPKTGLEIAQREVWFYKRECEASLKPEPMNR
jgi:hypothetical protein